MMPIALSYLKWDFTIYILNGFSSEINCSVEPILGGHIDVNKLGIMYYFSVMLRIQFDQ